jgi:2-hydroxychromene-2-carboxylate isomerase
MQRQVDYYFSLLSPWGYIGHKPFRDLVSTYNIKVNHKPVVLVDLFSETGGLPLMKRHPVWQRYRMVELPLARQARAEIPSAAGELAVQCPARRWRRDRCERGRVRSRSIFAAGLCRRLLADESGLPGKQLVERSGSEEISAAYEQNRQDALAADVFGSPVYVLDGEVFWGQDRVELLGDALKSGRAAYSSKV